MKWIVRGIATALVGGVSLLTAHLAPPGVRAFFTEEHATPVHVGIVGVEHAEASAIVVPEEDLARWSPPSWYPHNSELLAVAQMDAPGPRKGPSVRSHSAFVFDLDSGETLYEKNADEIRPVASITKLVSSLTLMSTGADLENSFCVSASQYPTRNGARSHLSTGDCLKGWDVLGAALVASDNRAAYGLAAVADLDIDTFVAHMNSVSADLGMTRSSWTDPSGLEDENMSTARDIARATVAVANHPILNLVASAPYWDIERTNGAGPRRLFSTDHLAGREDVMIEAAKTGYTDTARYCFTTTLRTPNGRHLVVTLLGAEGKLTRWSDMDRILDWVATQPAPTTPS